METNDRRVRKTETAIKDAITDLLERKDFASITIKDIADQADIGKATFYRHYPDKYVLVNQMVTSRLTEYYSQLDISSQITIKAENLQQVQQLINELKPFRGINQAELNVDSLIKSWLANFLRKTILSQEKLTMTQTTSKILSATLLELLDEYNSNEIPLTPNKVKQQLADLRMVLSNINYNL